MRGRIYKNSENFIGAEGGGGGADVGSIIASAGEAAGAIISALGEMRDAKLRRQYELQLAQLNEKQQAELSSKLIAAQTSDERRKVLAENLSATAVERIKAFSKKQNEVVLWVIGGIIIVGISLLVYKKMKKK